MSDTRGSGKTLGQSRPRGGRQSGLTSECTVSTSGMGHHRKMACRLPSAGAALRGEARPAALAPVFSEFLFRVAARRSKGNAGEPRRGIPEPPRRDEIMVMARRGQGMAMCSQRCTAKRAQAREAQTVREGVFLKLLKRGPFKRSTSGREQKSSRRIAHMLTRRLPGTQGAVVAALQSRNGSQDESGARPGVARLRRKCVWRVHTLCSCIKVCNTHWVACRRAAHHTRRLQYKGTRREAGPLPASLAEAGSRAAQPPAALGWERSVCGPQALLGCHASATGCHGPRKHTPPDLH